MRSKTMALLICSLFLGGCVLGGSEETASERFRFDIEGTEVPKVEVRIDDGSMEIIGTPSREVTVNVIKKARAHSSEAAMTLLEQLSVEAQKEDGTVRVEARQGGGWGGDHGISVRTGRVSASVEIRVPFDTNLDLFTNDGRVEIEQVQGRIEAETEDGRVRLRDIKGKVRIRTSDGSITGTGLDGDFDVTTEDGRIELEGSFRALRAETSDGSVKIRCDDSATPLKDDWLIRSSDGSIVLTLPTTLSARLEASTSDGRIENELPLSASEGSRSWLKGTLGDGGNLILVRTSDGRIHLRSR